MPCNLHATLLITIIFAGALHALALSSITTKATFENAGIRVTYTGDTDSNGTVAVEYRLKGTGDWLPGHPMVRIRGNRFATSLFNLAEGAVYEVRCVPSDPEGVSVGFDQPVEVSARSSEFPSGLRHRYVHAGAEGGDGSQERPFGTIGEAAESAQPGDMVHIMPGLYSGQVEPALSGNAGAFIVFAGEGDGVVLDGSERIETESG
jgi:hypothetical protein